MTAIDEFEHDGRPASVASEILPPSPGELIRKRARSHYGLIVGCSVLLLIFLVVVLTPWLAPYDPYSQDLKIRLMNPAWQANGSSAHLLGTDTLGRDFLSRLMYALRVSLLIAVCASLISTLIGTTIGILSGYFGERVDAFGNYLTTVKLSLPPFLIALSLVSVFGGSVLSLIIIIGCLTWERFAVVTRTVTQQLAKRDFVTAARAVGASQTRIILSELLPNLTSHIVVIFSLEIATVILIESVLSFLGLGVPAPTPSLGGLIAEGRNVMFFKPFLIAVPGLVIVALVIAINLAGDGLRDVWSPEGRN